MHQRFLPVALVCLFAVAPLQAGELEDYITKPDASYSYTVREEIQLGAQKGYIVRMTSQTWRGMKWEHWVSIIVPPHIEHHDKAILLIGGGSNRSQRPNANSNDARLLMAMATQVKAIVAVVEQVPNQPLFGDMYEDAIISYTFEQYLKGEGDDWPLLLPMVKAAVRAMDTTTQVVKDKLDLDITRYLVTGASKRGWTTYLTAAVDDRVFAIAPLVFDALNLGPQMRQQVATYGNYSEKVDDYTERGIQNHIDTEAGRNLLAIVDPFHYREKLDMPKLIVLGTNDPYWTVDASRLYFKDLPGESCIYYEPNAGHGLGPGVTGPLFAFINAVLNDQPLPKIEWEHQAPGVLHVTWDAPNATAILHQATSPNRDFRRATWRRTRLEGDGQCTVRIDPPQKGYIAYYVEVVHTPPNQLPYSVTTTIAVTPDTFPHDVEKK